VESKEGRRGEGDEETEKSVRIGGELPGVGGNQWVGQW
jgi:hypothetical protein